MAVGHEQTAISKPTVYKQRINVDKINRKDGERIVFATIHQLCHLYQYP